MSSRNGGNFPLLPWAAHPCFLCDDLPSFPQLILPLLPWSDPALFSALISRPSILPQNLFIEGGWARARDTGDIKAAAAFGELGVPELRGLRGLGRYLSGALCRGGSEGSGTRTPLSRSSWCCGGGLREGAGMGGLCGPAPPLLCCCPARPPV